MPTTILIEVPYALQPLERGDILDLPLCDEFDLIADGEVVGGGTRITDGKIKACYVEVEANDVNAVLPAIVKVLQQSDELKDAKVFETSPENRILFPAD
jgi:hypothetical protein